MIKDTEPLLPVARLTPPLIAAVDGPPGTELLAGVVRWWHAGLVYDTEDERGSGDQMKARSLLLVGPHHLAWAEVALARVFALSIRADELPETFGRLARREVAPVQALVWFG